MALPSYEQAILAPDLWETIAENLIPYINTPDDLVSLCRVCSHLNTVFSPLLWRDPMKIIFTGRKNIKKRLVTFHQNLSPKVELVQIMDYRYATDPSRHLRHLDIAGDGPYISNITFETYPKVKFVIIDNTDIEFPRVMGDFRKERGVFWDLPSDDEEQPSHIDLHRDMVVLFSASHCPNLDPGLTAQMPFCFTTLYLDLSYSHNIDAFTRVANKERLSRLQILKLRGTRLSNMGLSRIGANFEGSSLWSLDIRDNTLGTLAVDILDKYFSFRGKVPDRSLPSNWMEYPTFAEVPEYTIELPLAGAFVSMLKATSYTGDHNPLLKAYLDITPLFFADPRLWDPNRYLVDPPSYTARIDHDDGQESELRPSFEFRPDKIDEVIESHYKHPHYLETSALASKTGLTHLYISGNKIGAQQLFVSNERLFSASSRLQLLDCDNPESFINPFYKYKFVDVEAVSDPNLSHLGPLHLRYEGYCKDLPFNLEVLRVHHSFITQSRCLPIRDIKLEDAINDIQYDPGGKTPFAADPPTTLIGQRGIGFLPQCLGFRPNQNPKLRELTLTDVPRKSLGRVVSTLKFLIHSAADQEHHLWWMRNDPEFLQGRRSPKMLPGLRLIRLEFRKEEDKRGRGNERSATGDKDAEKFIKASEKDFSFFDGVDSRKPARVEDLRLLDVAEELKAFREKTRAGTIRSLHWVGVLQFVF